MLIGIKFIKSNWHYCVAIFILLYFFIYLPFGIFRNMPTQRQREYANVLYNSVSKDKELLSYFNDHDLKDTQITRYFYSTRFVFCVTTQRMITVNERNDIIRIMGKKIDNYKATFKQKQIEFFAYNSDDRRELMYQHIINHDKR